MQNGHVPLIKSKLEQNFHSSAKVEDAVSVELNDGLKLFSVPPPGSGIILSFILNVMENYNITSKDANDPLMHHRLIEAFKYAYAYRSQLGDPTDVKIRSLVNKVNFEANLKLYRPSPNLTRFRY